MAIRGGLRRGGALFWRWFTRWRKRYWPLRLALLVIVFAYPVYDVFRPLIRDLVVIAIEGIDTAGIPRNTHYESRLLIMREAKGLQRNVFARFDANRNGRLDRSEARSLAQATGLAPSELTGSALHADLDRLVVAAQRVHLLAPSVTALQLRHGAYLTARAHTDEFYQEYKREQEPLLRMGRPRWRDYLHGRTWAKGGREFLDQLLFNAGAVTGVHWPAWRWLLFVVLPAVLLSVYRFRRYEHLSRRFAEDPEFALAPCPRCHAPTHDARALRQQRLPSAAVAGVAVGLSLTVVLALAPYVGWALSPYVGWAWWDLSPFGLSLALPPELLAALGVLVLRWLLWPWEVHACHVHPRLRLVGVAVSALLVCVPAVAVTLLACAISA